MNLFSGIIICLVTILITNFLLEKEKLLVNGKEGLNSVELINTMVLSGLEEKRINLPLDENRYEKKLEEMISKSR